VRKQNKIARDVKCIPLLKTRRAFHGKLELKSVVLTRHSTCKCLVHSGNSHIRSNSGSGITFLLFSKTPKGAAKYYYSNKQKQQLKQKSGLRRAPVLECPAGPMGALTRVVRVKEAKLFVGVFHVAVAVVAR
jgi:hypothetical protein